MKIGLWVIFVFFAIAVGLYPMAYLFFDMSQGLLATKSSDLFQNHIWQFSFYQHIMLGAVALLTGWSQFSAVFRRKHLHWHRTLGKVYLIAVLLSGAAGLLIAFYATGGLVAITGFSGLAIGWLLTSLLAYLAIRRKEIESASVLDDQELRPLFCCRYPSYLAFAFPIRI